MAPARPWEDDKLDTDSVSKKDLVTFLHDHATYQFLKDRKLYGKVANITKTAKKPDLIAAYKELFESDAFRPDGETLEDAAAAAVAAAAASAPAKVEKKEVKKEAVVEEPKFTKQILKKGDGVNFPKKGDTVACFYTGTLPEGKVFDTNLGKKKPVPLKFKVGVGRVIKGWDEGLITMSKGEKAKLTIESEWAYGKKGLPEAKIPPNSPLIFEVELVSIE
ncbi:FK506-binding protein 2B [Borealophlyctis nickersoniae]|nr:FK506-binding protein 2B [Borealophlyctis nickersoniae]